jgi:hypothetical protein
MKLIDSKKLEDCFDGTTLFEYSFDEKIKESLIKKMGDMGRFFYYPDFLKPFYKIITSDDIQIKGIVEEKTMQVNFPQSNKEVKKKNFESDLIRIISNWKRFNSNLK